MDRQIPEDIEYKASISNMKAFGLAIKDVMPQIISLAAFILGIVGTILISLAVIFGPFMPTICLVGGGLYVVGHVLWQVTTYCISRGHALDAKSAIPEIDIKNPLTKILDKMDDELDAVAIVGVWFIVCGANAFYWSGIFFP